MIHFTFRSTPNAVPLLQCAVALTLQDAIDLIEAERNVGCLQVDHVRLATTADLVNDETLIAANVLENPMFIPLDDFSAGVQAQFVDMDSRYSEVCDGIVAMHDGHIRNHGLQPHRLDVYDVKRGKRFRVLMPAGVQYFTQRHTDDEFTAEDNSER